MEYMDKALALALVEILLAGQQDEVLMLVQVQHQE
jgi:hypothetical protein